LAGLDRLIARGDFIQPVSGVRLLIDIDQYSNPVRRFLTDHCVLANGQRTLVTELYCAFDGYCDTMGIERCRNSSWFGRELGPAMRDLAPDVTFEHKQPAGEPDDRRWYYYGIGLRRPEGGPRIKDLGDGPLRTS
jgi:hypothetical protein